MKVGFITQDWSHTYLDADGRPTLGGSGHYRVGLPARWLDRRGHATFIGPSPMIDKRTGRCWIREWPLGSELGTDAPPKAWPHADVIVFQRWMRKETPEIIRRARASGQVVVNDVDDWFFGLSPRNQAFRATSTTLQPDDNVTHYRRALAASDLVTCSTPYLADRLRRMGLERVEVIRNTIDLRDWTYREPTREPPVVGWVGVVSYRSGDLETMRGILGPFLERHGLRFHHSGQWGEWDAAAGLGIRTEITTSPMVAVADYPQQFAPIDIGIVPLSDIPFNHAKSAIKGMEYAAAGIPFVAAETHEYRWLESLGCGRVARKPKDWIRHLTELLDPDTRKAEAERNRRAVESQAADLRVIDWERSLEGAMVSPTVPA